MTSEAATSAIGGFARAVRLSRRANSGSAGDGTALELLIAPRFHALIETLIAQRLALPPQVPPACSAAPPASS